MRIAVRERDLLGSDDQRVFAGEVELVANGLLKRQQGVVDSAVDLRERAKRIRILYAERPRISRGASHKTGQQSAHPRGDGNCAGAMERGVDPLVQHHGIGGGGLEQRAATDSQASSSWRTSTTSSAARPMR